MADVKISALPAATTPLAGTEVLPIVQSSTTKKVAISDVTAGRAISASSLTLTTPLAVGSGGTGLTSLTAGYIPYASSSSALSFSSNLYSTGTNIGIGTASPATTFNVVGSAFFDGTTRVRQSGSVRYRSDWRMTAGETSVNSYDDTGAVYIPYKLEASTFSVYTGTGASNPMVLNASGNLGLGTSSPSSGVRLDVRDNSGFAAMQLAGTGIGTSQWTSDGALNVTIKNVSAGALIFGTNNTERMRIASDGSVGIGTIPSFPFQVQTTTTNGNYGAYLTSTGTTSTGSEVFYGFGYVTTQNVSTGTTSQMIHNLYQGYVGMSNAATTPAATVFRVNPAFLGASPSGTVSNLTGFNINSTSYQHSGTPSITITNTYGLYINNQGSVTTGYTKGTAYGIYLEATTGATTNYGIYSAGGKIVMQGVYDNTAGTANVSIDASGNLTRITSSIKYKKDVVTYENGLNKVLSLRPVTYRSKCEADLNALYGGFIAEEVDTLGLEEFIERNADGEVEAVRYPNMVALMASAIQELAAKVQALEAKVA